MGTYVVVKPGTEPVSLGEARAHLRLDTTDTDAMLAGYIIAARQYAENYTRRLLMQQTWAVTFDYGWPYIGEETRLDLPVSPVSQVSQVTYVDESGVTQTLAAPQYLVRGVGGTNFPYIVPAYNAVWPVVRAIPETIRVQFVGGYGTNPGDVPEPIRHAILFHVELLYDREPGLRDLLERTRDAMLDPYRMVRL